MSRASAACVERVVLNLDLVVGEQSPDFSASSALAEESWERAGKRPIRWLGRQDSNLGSRDQSPLPYRLATPQ
jgi:hypothetical protein